MASPPGPFTLVALGVVRGGRTEAEDDHWGDVEAEIVLQANAVGPDAATGLEEFSHIDVVYVFDRVSPDRVTRGVRHPRENPDWPEVGILAQRARLRPNRLGVSTCELLGVEGMVLRVRGLDAIDATPVLDVKPHVREFDPRRPVRQPAWISELMRDYW